MARSPAKNVPAAPSATRSPDRKRAVAAVVAKNPGQKPAPDAGVAGAPAKTSTAAQAPLPNGRLFAVTRSRGRAWNPEQPPEGQIGWSDHARFMNDLESSGFVVASGPLEGTPYTFLAMRAESEADARSRLANDPWELNLLLETTRIAGWDLKLGAGKF